MGFEDFSRLKAITDSPFNHVKSAACGIKLKRGNKSLFLLCVQMEILQRLNMMQVLVFESMCKGSYRNNMKVNVSDIYNHFINHSYLETL